MNNLKQKAIALARSAGLSGKEAEYCGEKFLAAVKKKRAEQRTTVVVKVHSVDSKAGEIIIRVHETSSREVHEILHDIVKRYNKDPDKWTVANKLNNTTGGYTSYVCSPIQEETSTKKKQRKTASRKKKAGDKHKQFMRQLKNLDAEEQEKVLQKLLQHQDEEGMDM